MSSFLGALVIAALIATAGVLAVGLFSMVRGGEFNRRHGNQLMRARVITQGVTLLLVLIYFLAERS